MKKITSVNNDWKVKFEFLIQRLKDLVSQEGKKLVLVNVEAGRNPKKQFDKYMQAVKLVRDKVECVVSTSLLGEERIFEINAKDYGTATVAFMTTNKFGIPNSNHNIGIIPI